MLWTDRLNDSLTCQLGLPIYSRRAVGIRLGVGLICMAVKYVIGRNMDKWNSQIFRNLCQIGRTDFIYSTGIFNIGFCLIDACIGSRINDYIVLSISNNGFNLINIPNIQALPVQGRKFKPVVLLQSIYQTSTKLPFAPVKSTFIITAR